MKTKFDDFVRESLILETLKSDSIETVEKKISNFFGSHGFNKKAYFFDEVESPFYQIVHDRVMMKRELDKYIHGTDSFVKSLSKKDRNFMINSYRNSLEDFKYGDIFVFTDKNTPEITNDLLHLIETIGYFVSIVNLSMDKPGHLEDKSKIRETLLSQQKISIAIEPYYDTKVDFDGEYLYHTTDKKNLDKILRLGLVPKSKNTRSFYPERIYLSPNREWMDSIRGQLNLDKKGDYVDLEIQNFNGLSLYRDVRFKGGFYTYDNIHPKYIKVL